MGWKTIAAAICIPSILVSGYLLKDKASEDTRIEAELKTAWAECNNPQVFPQTTIYSGTSTTVIATATVSVGENQYLCSRLKNQSIQVTRIPKQEKQQSQ